MHQSVKLPRRRWPRRALAVAIGLVVTVQSLVVFLHASDETSPLAVDDAVARFRATTSVPLDPSAGAAGEDDGADALESAPAVRAASAAAPAQLAGTAEPAPPGAEEGNRSRAAVGVYVYKTEGHEEIDAFGGSRHDYPPETTVTYSNDDCGLRERWAPLEDRYDDRLLCPGPGGDEVRWFDAGRAFFGRRDSRRLVCEPGSLARPVPAAAGQKWSFRCVDERTDARSDATVVSVAAMDVGGTAVTAVHIRILTTVTGENTATSTTEVWVDDDTGLLLRRTHSLDGSSSSPAGNVAYRDRYTIELESMTPRT